MKFKWISIVYFALPFHWNVYGQHAACFKDEKTLDNCDGTQISNNNINIDFGEIEYQCNCSITVNFIGQMFYGLAKNPGYAECGTAIRVTDNSNQIYRLVCVSTNIFGLDNRSSTVELEKVNPVIVGSTSYCVRVFTNDISNNITASCGSFKSTSTVVQQNTAKDIEKITTTDETHTKPEESVQTTLRVINQTQSVTDDVYSFTSKSTQESIWMKEEEEIYFPKWVLLGAGIGISLLVFLTIIFIVMRNRKRIVKNNICYMRESLVIQNQVLEKKDEKVRELTENPLYQPADDSEMSQSSKTVTSEGKQTQSQVKDIPLDEVEYGLRENPLYQSADDEINETEENTRTESNANYSYYSEIDGNPEKTRDNCVTYDYAYACSLSKSTDD